jgi:hypothetical protein
MENNPKALNLDAVRMSDSNVTVGFKCPPELKLILAQEAERSGLTLSNYVCKLVDFELKEKLQLREKTKLLTAALKKIQSQLSFFKNKILFELLEKHKGKSVSYFNRDGVLINLQINTIEDVFNLIVHSFKYEK